MKNKILEMCQTFSRCALQPVMFMSITGTVIALSVILNLDFMPDVFSQAGAFIKSMMDSFMNNLALIFCVGISSAMAKKKKADAAILGVLTFLMFMYANNAWLQTNDMLQEPGVQGLYGTGQAIVLGMQVTDMGVFLGLILGCLSGFIHNKFSKVEFIQMFSVYGGSRFAYAVMIPVVAVFAISVTYIWPFVNNAINELSTMIANSGAFGVFSYNFGNRFLIPTGLHHLFWMPFSYTPLGGSVEIADTVYSGATNIWIAQMANGASLAELHESSRFLFYGVSKMFAPIGIALAMIKTSKPENRARVKGLILPLTFVACIAGLTEPLEFSFLFISPMLWLAHSLLDALAGVVLYFSGISADLSGGIINTLANNMVVPMSLTKIYLLLPLGALFSTVWYLTFKTLIVKFDIKTPGREESEDIKLATKQDYKTRESGNEKAVYNMENIKNIVEGLGGEKNIEVVNNCFTRLRIDVLDINEVNDEYINRTKNSGIVKKGKNVQIIIGMGVQKVKDDMCEYLGLE